MHLLFVCFALLSFYSMDLNAMNQNLEVQGHRGARWVRPENTIAAFKYALEAKVDTLELDTLVTKDNHVVVVHDPILNKEICLDSEGKPISEGIKVRDLTLSELKKFDCGTIINPRFKEQTPAPKATIPTLDEFFDFVLKQPHGKKVKFNIEAKSEEEHPEYAPTPNEFAKLLLSIVKKHGVQDRTTLQSFDHRVLKAIRHLDKKITLSALLEHRPKESLVSIAKSLDANIISPDYQWLTKKDIEDLHKAGIRCIPWTINEPADWNRFIGFGVDGIITDNPKALLALLGRSN